MRQYNLKNQKSVIKTQALKIHLIRFVINTDYAFARNAEITISGGTFEEQLKAMQSLEKNGILHAAIQYPNTPFHPKTVWKITPL